VRWLSRSLRRPGHSDRRLYPILVDTVALSGAILLIIATATAIGWALTQSGFAQQLADMLRVAPDGRIGIMLLSIAHAVNTEATSSTVRS